MTLYKGRYYIVTDADSHPGFLVIREEDAQNCNDFGIFEVNRFSPDTRAF
jgi:hypothetical protein